MREIKFRGYSGEKWLFGNLDIDYKTKQAAISDDRWWRHPVRFKTVGQFTGLKDAKGKEIYEGDILLYRLPENMIALNNSDKSVVFYGHGMFLVSHGKIEFSVNQVLGVHGDDAVVIGNVYDNPEILEATE